MSVVNKILSGEAKRGKYVKEKSVILNLISGLENNLNLYNGYIAGGCITSVFSGEKVNDIDIFFRNPTDLNGFEGRVKNKSSKTICNTKWANSYKYINEDNKEINIQIIKKEVGEPEDMVDRFDFTVCQAIYDFKENKMIMVNRFLRDLAKKELIFTGSKYPLASLYRVKKYMEKGFHISGIELIKLALTVQNIDIDNEAELGEHIAGFDIMILRDLLNELEEDNDYVYENFIEKLNDYLKNSVYKDLEELEDLPDSDEDIEDIEDIGW